jgi:hypothetical protein
MFYDLSTRFIVDFIVEPKASVRPLDLQSSSSITMPSSPEALGGHPGDSGKIPWSPEGSRLVAPSSQEHAYLKSHRRLRTSSKTVWKVRPQEVHDDQGGLLDQPQSTQVNLPQLTMKNMKTCFRHKWMGLMPRAT